jgi:hypothetical protein
VHIVGIMANWDTVCEIASSLAGAHLDGPHAEAPAWRVNGKMIVRRNPRLDGTAEGEDEVIAIRTDHDERAALLEDDPATFFLMDQLGTLAQQLGPRAPCTVSREQLAELITEAWRQRGTKRPRLDA